jgi:type IV pilus assembly protein PilC
MMAAGERSGQLPEVMAKISDFSQEELDGTVSRVTTYIEPIMIIFMGVVIGGVATALLLPIFNMGRVMSGG